MGEATAERRNGSRLCRLSTISGRWIEKSCFLALTGEGHRDTVENSSQRRVQSRHGRPSFFFLDNTSCGTWFTNVTYALAEIYRVASRGHRGSYNLPQSATVSGPVQKSSQRVSNFRNRYSHTSQLLLHLEQPARCFSPSGSSGQIARARALS